jgi:hypothetical protein
MKNKDGIIQKFERFGDWILFRKLRIPGKLFTEIIYKAYCTEYRLIYNNRSWSDNMMDIYILANSIKHGVFCVAGKKRVIYD